MRLTRWGRQVLPAEWEGWIGSRGESYARGPLRLGAPSLVALGRCSWAHSLAQTPPRTPAIATWYWRDSKARREEPRCDDGIPNTRERHSPGSAQRTTPKFSVDTDHYIMRAARSRRGRLTRAQQEGQRRHGRQEYRCAGIWSGAEQSPCASPCNRPIEG